MKNKKIIAILSIITTLTLFASCGKGASDGKETTDPESKIPVISDSEETGSEGTETKETGTEETKFPSDSSQTPWIDIDDPGDTTVGEGSETASETEPVESSPAETSVQSRSDETSGKPAETSNTHESRSEVTETKEMIELPIIFA